MTIRKAACCECACSSMRSSNLRRKGTRRAAQVVHGTVSSLSRFYRVMSAYADLKPDNTHTRVHTCMERSPRRPHIRENAIDINSRPLQWVPYRLIPPTDSRRRRYSTASAALLQYDLMHDGIILRAVKLISWNDCTRAQLTSSGCVCELAIGVVSEVAATFDLLHQEPDSSRMKEAGERP